MNNVKFVRTSTKVHVPTVLRMQAPKALVSAMQSTSTMLLSTLVSPVARIVPCASVTVSLSVIPVKTDVITGTKQTSVLRFALHTSPRL